MKTSARWTKIFLTLIIIFQSILYICAGIGKSYIHMDEAYSLALTHYDGFEITENPDFYNTWHTSEYFQKYLAIQEDELTDFTPIYENQRNDVHPPLFYFFLSLAQSFVVGRFSKWPGIILNVIIHIGITLLFYDLWRQVMRRGKAPELKALILTACMSLTIASVSSAVYIRMYALLTLVILWTLCLHLRLAKTSSWRPLTLLAVALATLAGILTQYFYAFFLVPLAIVFLIHQVRQRNWQGVRAYVGVMLAAVVLSLIVWPYSLQHTLFSYRGQGVMTSFSNPITLLQDFWAYCEIINYNVFHRLLVPILLMIVSVTVYIFWKRRQKFSLPFGLQLMLWPTLIYFVITAIASPFIELRYVMPVCGLIFGLVFYGLYQLLGMVWSEKTKNIIAALSLAVVWLAAPIQLALGQMRIELLYRDRQAVMSETAAHPQAPILYFISSKNNRFLDNILPFTIAEQSYLALDFDYTNQAGIRKILQNQDLTHGLFVWVSDQQDHPETLAAVQLATGLDQVQFVQIINTCTVYYLSK